MSANIVVQIKPIFQTKKIGQILALKEKKPPIVNQSMVYKFECDLCDVDFVLISLVVDLIMTLSKR